MSRANASIYGDGPLIERRALPGETITRVDAAGDEYTLVPPGAITQREYFASIAMQGILANPGRCVPGAADSLTPQEFSALMAKVSIEFADALLAELEKAK